MTDVLIGSEDGMDVAVAAAAAAPPAAPPGASALPPRTPAASVLPAAAAAGGATGEDAAAGVVELPGDDDDDNGGNNAAVAATAANAAAAASSEHQRLQRLAAKRRVTAAADSRWELKRKLASIGADLELLAQEVRREGEIVFFSFFFDVIRSTSAPPLFQKHCSGRRGVLRRPPPSTGAREGGDAAARSH